MISWERLRWLILVGSSSSCSSLPMALSSLTSKGGKGKSQKMIVSSSFAYTSMCDLQMTE